jgi:hypothetical protein
MMQYILGMFVFPCIFLYVLRHILCNNRLFVAMWKQQILGGSRQCFYEILTDALIKIMEKILNGKRRRYEVKIECF